MDQYAEMPPSQQQVTLGMLSQVDIEEKNW